MKRKLQDSGRETEIFPRLFDSENPGKQVASKVKTAKTKNHFDFPSFLASIHCIENVI